MKTTNAVTHFTSSINRIVCLILAFCFILSMLPGAATSATGENKLTVTYNSGAEKKLVITGPLVPLAAEKVYTESELKAFRKVNPDTPDLYYVTSMNTVGTKRVYTVDGVSMFDVLDHAGLSRDIYRNAKNFLFTVGGDSAVWRIGPGVITTGQGDITSPTGTLDEPRYTYPIPTYFNYNMETDDPESITDGQEIPWLLGFREDYAAVTSASLSPVAEPTNANLCIRPYFGQRNIQAANNPLFNNATCRLFFAESDLSVGNARNLSSALVFDLFGVGYDRANIMIGPRMGNNPIGEKVKCTFDTGSATIYLEGTSVESLLAATGGTTSIKISFANGSELTVPTTDIAANNYTLVYATGSSPDTLSPVEHTNGSVKGYFDLYRDGAAPIENVTGIAAAGENIPPIITADSTDNYVNNNIAITFASNAAYSAAITSIAVTGAVIVPHAELMLTSTTITIPGSYFKTAGDYTITVNATGYTTRTVAQIIGLQPPVLIADSDNNTLTYGRGLDGTLNDIVITFDSTATGWQESVSAVKMGTAQDTAPASVSLDRSKYTVSAGKITINKSIITGIGATSKTTWYIVVEANGYAYTSVAQPLYWDTPTLTADTTNNVVGQAIDVAFTPDNSNWSGPALRLKVEKDSALITAQSVEYLTKTANLITIKSAGFGAVPVPGDYTLTFVYVTLSTGVYRDVTLTQTLLPSLTADSTNNTLKNSNPITLTYSHTNNWFDVNRLEINSYNAPNVYTAIPNTNWNANMEGITVAASVFTKAYNYRLRVITNKGTIEIEQLIKSGSVARILDSIAVTVEPDKTQYAAGDSLNLAGLIVTADYDDDSAAVLAVADYTTEPANGAKLDSLGVQTVTVSFTDKNIIRETSFAVTVREAGEIEPIPDDSSRLFEIVDKRNGQNIPYQVTRAIVRDLTKVGVTYNYSTVNTFGSPHNYTNMTGPVLTDLFDYFGIGMNGTDAVVIRSGSDKYDIPVLWEYLTAQRWYYPNLPANLVNGQAPSYAFDDPVEVPAIIAMNRENGTLLIGQRAPHEQTNNVFVHNIAFFNEAENRVGQIILTDGDGAKFPDITSADPVSGTTVSDGTGITLVWIEKYLLDFSDGHIYFTTDGSEPDLCSALYNYNTYSADINIVFKPVISAADADGNGNVTLKVKVFGKAKYPSDTSTFTYKLPGPDAPQGLAGVAPASRGQMGSIRGTTSSMEYCDSQGKNWSDCTQDSTAAYPGNYYVRFKASGNDRASESVLVSVPSYSAPPPPPSPVAGDTVLSVYNGTTKVKDFTNSDISNMSKTSPATYSTYNTWPTYEIYTDISGIRVPDLLKAAGADYSPSSEVTFYSSDGFYASLMVSDLTAERYYFNTSGKGKNAVPSVISFDEDGGYLYFGQLAAQEQTHQAFVKKIDRIVIGGSAKQWDPPTASPAYGSVRAGGNIRLNLPSGSGDAKIYYTLNGSDPTVESTMYNVTAERWLAQKGIKEHPPITVTGSDTFTITARVIGLGGIDSKIVKFTYSVSDAVDLTDENTPLADGENASGANIPFRDVTESVWFYDDVRYVYERGMMRGTADNVFSPNMNVTRGMIVTVLWRLAGEPEVASDNLFRDVAAGTYYADAVLWAFENRIVEGYGGGMFGPNDSVTRQDLIVLLMRYTDFAEITLPLSREYAKFSDASRIAGYALDAVERGYTTGIINGKSAGIFDPTGNATRAEFAAMLRRLLERWSV